MRWRHPHTAILGAAAGVYMAHNGTTIFLAGIALGAVLVLLVLTGRRLVRRVDRALPDRATHPCAQCQAPISGRNRYCSETCREIAADERAERRRRMQRFEEYGEVPF